MIHPFEKAGLGKAPYRVIGLSVNKYQACQGASIQPGGLCDFCGTGIMYEYHIRSVDGIEFKVGCDCVRRVDQSLVKSCAVYRKDYAARTRKEAREEAERDANGGLTRAEIWANERAIRAAQYQAERDARDARRMASVHCGTVGKREEFELVLSGWYDFETTFGYRQSVTRMYFLEDESGNLFVWKSTSGGLRIKDDSGEIVPNKRGQKFKVKGTVKEHAEYKGAKQTVLSRVKQL